MTTSGWVLGTLIFTMIFYICLGSYLGKFTKSIEDFYVAGRKMPWYVIGGTFMATWTSAAGLVGVAGCAWLWGLTGALWYYGSFFGVAVILLWIALPMRRGMFLTASDFFANRFKSERLRMVAVITIVFGMGGYFIAQVVAMGRILEMLANIPYQATVWCLIFVLVVYLFSSGMMGVAITDTIMFFTFLLAALAFPYILGKYGGFHALLHTLPQIKPGIWLVSGTKGSLGPDLGYWIGIVFAYLALTTTSPHLLTRAFCAKNEKALVHGLTWGFLGIAILLPLYFMAVMMVNVEVNTLGTTIKKVDHVVAYMLNNMLPTWLSCVIIAGIAAACLSTVNTIAVVLAQTIVRDLWQKGIMKRRGIDVPDAAIFKYTQYALVAVCIFMGIIASLLSTQSAFILAWSAGAFAMTFLPIVLLGLYWDRLTEKAAYYGMLSSLFLYIGLSALCLNKEFAIALVITPVLLTTIYSFVIAVVISFMTNKTTVEVEAWNNLKIMMFPGPNKRVYGNAGDYISLGSAFLVFTTFLAWLIYKIMST